MSSLKFFLPRLIERPVIIQFLVLLLLILVSTVIFMAIGTLVALPFYGKEAFAYLSNMNFSNNDELISFLKYFQVVNQIGVFIAPAILFAYLYNRRAAAYLHTNNGFGLQFFILSVVLIIMVIPFINRLVEINEQMQLPGFLWRIESWMRSSEDQTQELTSAFLNTNTISGLIINLFVIALLAALSEELLFRGVILQLFYKSYRNIHVAVLFSAILFSALHMQFYGFLPRTLLGIIFGYLFVWSGSIWIPIILHFIFNGISVVAAYLYQTGNTGTSYETLGTDQSNLIVLASAIGSVAVIYLLNRRRVIFNIQ